MSRERSRVFFAVMSSSLLSKGCMDWENSRSDDDVANRTCLPLAEREIRSPLTSALPSRAPLSSMFISVPEPPDLYSLRYTDI